MIVNSILYLYSALIIKGKLKAHEKNNSIYHSSLARGNGFT